MKNKKLFVSLVALSLLLSSLVACKKISSENSFNSVSSDPQEPTSISLSKPPVEQQEVRQIINIDPDGNGETITWDAQDASKIASDGFQNNGKFKNNGDYVQYTFIASMPMKAKLYVVIEDRSEEPYDRHKAGQGVEKGHQSIWFNWYDDNLPRWKYNVTLNGTKVDQDKQSTIKIGEEDVSIKELMYTDFLMDGASTLEAPWIEFDLKQGKNTLKIERNTGYSVNMKSFKVVGKKINNR